MNSTSSVRRLLKEIATLNFIGYLPVAPGTWGTLAGLAFFMCFRLSLPLHLSAIAFCTVVGIIASGIAEEMIGEQDSSHIIIDEFTGVLISLFALPRTPGYIIAAFLLFRFFDILKPLPIRMVEKMLPGGIGIMSDDIMAGVFTNLVLQGWHVLYRNILSGGWV
jgi:phosphatidylglycerophosphatase A